MENINIIIEKSSRKVNLFKSVIGNDGENLQENFIFSFSDEFVDGTARLEIIKPSKTKSYMMLEKVGETYQIPVKSAITKNGKTSMQLVITEGTNDEEIPIFKSNIFYVVVNSSVNAEIEEPEEYSEWINIANTKLNTLDEAILESSNLDIDISKVDNTATITLTDKEGNTKSVEIYDGEKGATGERGPQGPAGKDGTNGTNGTDAKINGVNTLNIEAGENIILDQSGSTLTISSIGGGSGGTTNYNNLSNKPKINNVELSGNKTTSDLGITIPTVPTNVSAFTNDAGYLTQHQDISGKQDTIQYSTMPTASSETVGKVVQYIGTTDNTYTKGYFYIGITDGTNYDWQQLNVQQGGGSSGYIKQEITNGFIVYYQEHAEMFLSFNKDIENLLSGNFIQYDLTNDMPIPEGYTVRYFNFDVTARQNDNGGGVTIITEKACTATLGKILIYNTGRSNSGSGVTAKALNVRVHVVMTPTVEE